MNVIFKVSLRNLIRQKRRNILLGIGIAFGTCILIIANAFSHGISDILLNKLIARMAGHIIVSMKEKDEKTFEIIRDKERIKQVIMDNVEGVEYVYENVSIYARGRGNGATEFIVLVGVEPDEEFYEELPVTEGDLHNLSNPEFENPIAVYDTMAEDLNVHLHDTIHAKFETVYGQSQTARFTVIAILKSGNPFMSFALFSHLNDLKPLLDFQEHETAFFSVMIERLKNPRVVIEQADQLHKALVPNVAGYKGRLQGNGQTREVQVISVLPEEKARATFTSQLHITAGNVEETLKAEQEILLSQTMAEELDVEIGDQVTLTYETRFEDTPSSREYQIGTIFKANEVVTHNMLFLPAEQMYATFFPSPPKQTVNVDPKSSLFSVLIKEWLLLDRSPDQKTLEKKHRELNNSDWQGAALDITTMYEAASDVLKLEQVLDVVTMIAVLILFFIILIGVINTLRMTIRERTREIGTVRAIGMRRLDVWLSFITEVWFLTLFASIVGIILAFATMYLLGLITFQNDESFFMIFLVNKHLHFVPTVGDIVINLVIISIITVATAFFPALRAARMSAAEALRHYE